MSNNITTRTPSVTSGGRLRRVRVTPLVGALLVCLMLLWSAAALGAEAPPSTVSGLGCERADHSSVVVSFQGGISTDEETHWRVEYAENPGGPWTLVPGGSGTITKEEAESAPANHVEVAQVALGGLNPETVYQVRAVLTDLAGTTNEEAKESGRHGEHGCEAVPLHPRPGSIEVTSLSGTSARIGSNLFPDGFASRWRFEYATSQSVLESGAGTVGAEGAISQAEAEATPFQAGITLEADLSGLSPSTTYYVRLFAEDEPEWPPKSGTISRKESVSEHVVSFETAGPPGATTLAVHAAHLGTLRALGMVVPHGYDTHYHFQYVSSEDFDESGWAKAASTPEADAGAGEFNIVGGSFPTSIVGQDLPGLAAGKSYEYRLLASNASPGSTVVAGAAQMLTVPGTPSPSGEGGGEACPNQALRTGPSANLPDCRAYEQLTPVDKEGSQELFNYGISFSGNGALPAPSGEGLVVQQQFVNWGSAPRDGQSPYFFSRGAAGWLMEAASLQPETGVDIPHPQLYSADLSHFAFESGAETAIGGRPPVFEYRVGPVGGPYTTVASVPGEDVLQGTDGWVASSEDFSKLVLQVADHMLLGHPTGTTAGNDLYEYAGGRLRQLNVLSDGSAIGSCGATIAHGHEGGEGGIKSSPHALSGDGSRVFFEQIPGSDCGEPSHLYMRIGGSETVDIGAYRFLAANTQGTELLLIKQMGEAREVLSYDTETHTAKPLKGFTVGEELKAPLISADLSTVYFGTAEQLDPEAPPPTEAALNLYRYDIATETLQFVVQIRDDGNGGEVHASPDGRYYYFDSSGVGGVPGGSIEPLSNNLGNTGFDAHQVYRYDSVEDVVECMSCASPFDPEPKTGAFFGVNQGSGTLATQNALPAKTISSANGDYAFFETPAALVPQDIDGEVAPEGYGEHSSIEQNTSVSSDVYEWRRDGIDGCTALQGCLALLTNGEGGLLNLLIGSTESGRDVFIYTGSRLVAQDNDTAGDIYDVRIDGGMPPPPPRPVECEADQCSNPPPAPNDATPSSFTFNGLGNLTAPAPAVSATPTPRSLKCAKGKTPSAHRCVKRKSKRKAKKTKRPVTSRKRRKS